MTKFKAILFDLDGTLLDSNMENFLPHYFSRLAARVAHIAPPKAFIAHLLAATEFMLANDGRATNQEVFAAAFYPFAGHTRAELEPIFEDFYERDFPGLQEYTQRKPEARAVVQLAFALAKTGRFTAAHEVIRHLRSELEMRNLQESSGMAQFHLLRARVLTLEGEYEGALAACDSALGLSAYIDRPEIYRNLAEIRQRMGDTEGALDACSEALSSNPRQPFALLTLTRIYHKRNDTAMTAEVGNRLLQLWSGADADFSPLQELRRLLGQKPPTRSGS